MGGESGAAEAAEAVFLPHPISGDPSYQAARAVAGRQTGARRPLFYAAQRPTMVRHSPISALGEMSRPGGSAHGGSPTASADRTATECA